jgi:hypothetical protein
VTRPLRCGPVRGRTIGWVFYHSFVSPSTRVPSLPLPVAPLISFRTSRPYASFPPSMSEHPSFSTQPSFDTLNMPSRPLRWAREAWIHITRHVGVGIICSVAYFDPYLSLLFPFFLQCLNVCFFTSRGNWSVDLQAGSDYGYKLLFVVLLSGIFAVILQVFFFVSIPRC